MSDARKNIWHKSTYEMIKIRKMLSWPLHFIGLDMIYAKIYENICAIVKCYESIFS